MNKYAYFFTRQDIFPEYQLVQTAHAALKLGVASMEPWDEGEIESMMPYQHKTFNANETYFTCVGVRDLNALMAVADILKAFHLKFEVFSEPDIGNEITSIAVYPIDEDCRGPLLAFNLLKFGNKG